MKYKTSYIIIGILVLLLMYLSIFCKPNINFSTKINTISTQDYQNILNSIPKDSLVVYLTSLLSLNLDIINNFNNVIIVLTKKDLLPKSVKDYKLIDYVSKRVNNYLDIEVISSVKNYNLDSLMNKIKKYSNNKEVYFIGNTNSGKSTLINKKKK